MIEHVTEAPNYIGNPDGDSYLPRHAMSADGRYVVFTSDAMNLSGGYSAVLLRDRHTGDLTPIFPDWGITDLTMSADGNYIAFRACQPFWRSDYAPICDILAYDRRTPSITPMSVAADGALSDADSSLPVFSTTGRFVVFRTNSTNLLPAGAAPGQLVVRDRDADGNGIFDEPGTVTIQLVSAANGSSTAGNDVSDSAEISDDGRYIAFRSMASNLVAGTNIGPHLFERDRVTLETRVVDRRPTGQPSPYPVDRPEISMSADGRYVAFASTDRQLVAGNPGDTDDFEDVFVYDHDTQVVSRLDLSDAVASAMDVDMPMLTADGRYVAMRAWSLNSADPWGDIARAVFVYDRTTGASTKVSVLPGGGDLNWDVDRPAISADGTVVLFTSRATNAAPSPDPGYDKIFAAVHFDVQPATILVPGRGGEGTFSVTTQQHTRWSAKWDWTQYWLVATTTPFGIAGSGTITFNTQQANPDVAQRSVAITIGSRTVTFTEDAGVSITSLTPSAGPLAGGTIVTVHGTGFEPGMRFHTNNGATAAEFVDATTLRAPTPPGQAPGLTWVSVETSDGRFAWMNDGFRYLDATPPNVWPMVEGALGDNGWYTTDVIVSWVFWDAESEITATSGCAPVVLNTDTAGTTVTCAVTSEGGTATQSITIKRDATPPVIVITQPTSTIYSFGASVPAAYSCNDALSGTAGCVGQVEIGESIDTSYVGFDYSFYVIGRDQAGNLGWSMANYDVGTLCYPTIDSARAWWRMEGDTLDLSGGLVATAHNLTTAFLPAMVGQGFSFPSRTGGFLEVAPSSRLDFDNAVLIAMWIKPADDAESVLVAHPSQYVVKRLAGGAIQWAFAQSDGGSISATLPAAAPRDRWTHLAVTFDNGVVNTFLNGRLVRTDQRPGALRAPQAATSLTIGGQDDPVSDLPFVGSLDELQLFDTAAVPYVPGLYLAGSHGLCVPAATTLAVNVPTVLDYGTSTYSVSAALLDADGQPIAGQNVTLSSGYGASIGTTTLVTDANGAVSWNPPANFGSAGTYTGAFRALFEGDTQYQRAFVSRDIVVQKLTPQVTWPAPADIVYGTPLGGAQLDATADVPGTFSYSPAAGSVPGAGVVTLAVTFHPSDAANYNDTVSSVALNVQKAQPSMTITGGSFTYDGQPHPASASASDYLGQPLSPVTITYNGTSSAPVNADSYSTVATYAGDANYVPRSVSATITIGKATPAVTWPSPSVIIYGAPLGSVQLNATATVAGTFTYTPPAGTRLAAGSGIQLSAAFAPADSANYLPVTTTRSIDVLKAPLTITAANTTKVFGAPLPPFSATGSGFVNGDSMASLAGSLTFTTAAAATSQPGTYSVTPGGLTSADYAITFAAGSLAITHANSVVASSASANPSGFDQGVTFSASVSIVSPGAGSPTGTVEFRDGSTRLGTVALLNGSASLSTNGFSAGSHAISAIYSGDASFTGSTQSFTQTVLASAQSSATALASSSNPATTGANITLTATVSAPAGLSGSVAFYDGSSLIGTAALSGTKAKLVISTLANGAHAITARYLGNAAIPPSISPVFSQTIKPSSTTLRNSTATVVASPSPSALDQTVTFTATISGNQSTPPTGVAIFFVDGMVVSGQVTLAPSGNVTARAVFTTAALAHGVHDVTVAYLGDGTYKGDTGTTALTVN